ncbi:cache domain-containing protein [Geopsychrobacter electrodiphilus]|uniref:cache domain-containing protein n=1 Tax=Geopsychrobacter electrodiphilus TaxID=225196 RepID=UPI000370197D|nr:cache domain-containing protein [Geopsychrobacter electrodiphilus]
MNLKTKTTLIVMVFFSALILVVVGLTYRSTRALIDQTIIDNQRAIATDAAKATEVWLNQQMKILNATAASIDMAAIGKNSITLRPLKMAMKAGHFSDVYIGLTGGLLIDGADWPPPADYDPRARPWYKRAIQAGRTAFTTPYIDFVTMKLVIALVTPLSVDGELVGVMGADTVLDTLVENVVNIKVADTGYAFIAEKAGTILVHPNQAYVMKTRLQDIEPNLHWKPDTSAGLSSGTMIYRSVQDGTTDILAYQQIANTDWFLCTTVPLKEAYALTRKTTVLYAAEIVLMVLGGLAFVTLIGGVGSVLVLWGFRKRFETQVLQQQAEITDINKDLQWNIHKRKEMETYYQTLFNVANDAILLSKELLYVECNEKASQMFGLPREALIGKSMLEVSPPFQPDGRDSANRVQGIIDNAREGGQKFFVWTFQRADGTEFPAEVGLKILHLDNEELTLASIRDISKRVNAEEQLRQAQKMAAMGEMLGAIAHQWRQPLNALSTYVASVPSAYFNNLITRDFVDRLVSGADAQIQFMSKTIDDFRHFFKPSKQKTPFALEEAVDSARKLMEPRLKQHGVRLLINRKGPQNPLIVYGFQSEFVHVLVNILANAMDSINEKPLSAENPAARLIEIEIRDLSSAYQVRIKDDGCGIPEHLLTKIFSPYFTTKGTASGTGIGLYMAKMIVEKEMDGVLSATNGKVGSVFTIRLPHAQSQENHA